VVSPKKTDKYSDGDNNYTFVSIQNQLLFYLTPLGGVFRCNLETELVEGYVVVEKYELNNEDYLIVTAGIKNIVAIEINGEYLKREDYKIETKFNYIIFNKKYTGELKIAYKTDIYRAIIPPTQIPKDYKIYASYYNQKLFYTLKSEYNGYYPLPYKYNFSLITEWNIPPNVASEKEFKINGETYKANHFGEIEIEFKEYGCCELTTDGYDPLYVIYRKNKFNITQESEECLKTKHFIITNDKQFIFGNDGDDYENWYSNIIKYINYDNFLDNVIIKDTGYNPENYCATLKKGKFRLEGEFCIDFQLPDDLEFEKVSGNLKKYYNGDITEETYTNKNTFLYITDKAVGKDYLCTYSNIYTIKA
jgi:hypothetical protein